MLLVFYAKSQWKVGFLQSLCLYFDENNGGNYNYDDGDNNNDNDNYIMMGIIMMMVMMMVMIMIRWCNYETCFK
ncbi:unnamed protein product [Rhizophagus irregularis]|nr:unnamed protein product [Rhizophagus irregularis]